MNTTLRTLFIPQPKSKVKAGEGLVSGNYKFFTSSPTQSRFLDTYQYDEEALIFGTGGSASVHYCNEPFSTSTDCIVVYGHEDVNLKLVYYYLSGQIHLLQNGFKGAGLQHISKDYILNIPINLPDRNAQDEIVKTFDIVEQVIGIFSEKLFLLDKTVKSRFVEMFGDVIQNDRSWNIRIFSEITTSRLGKMLDSKQQTGTCSYPYLANFNVQWFYFDVSKLNQMDFSDADREEFKLEDGDLLICEGGEIGRCAVWHNEIQPCYFQKALHRVRCDTDMILPDYLAWWFNYNCEHHGFAAIEGAKATISHLPGVKLKRLQVAVPPIALQQAFAAFVSEIDKSKLAVKRCLEKAEYLKSALMQEYFG